MNYDEMPAGPEMDRLVAEKVMGWSIKRHYQPEGMIFHAKEDDAIFVDGKMRWWANAWSPSTNIAHAWEVVDAIAGTVRDGLDVEVVIELMGKRHGAVARVHLVDEEGRGAREIAMVVADTAPLAICRAALKAMAAK